VDLPQRRIPVMTFTRPDLSCSRFNFSIYSGRFISISIPLALFNWIATPPTAAWRYSYKYIIIGKKVKVNKIPNSIGKNLIFTKIPIITADLWDYNDYMIFENFNNFT